MDDVSVDDESPIDEWIAIGYQRGLMAGVAAGVLAASVIAAGLWMLS